MTLKDSPLILIHGAWQGSWVWAKLSPLLRHAGFHPVAIDLPGNGVDDTPPEQVDLECYLDFFDTLLKDLPEKVGLVGHSGGGLVATAVAERFAERIGGIAYIAGMMLPAGMSFAALQAEVDPPGTPPSGVSSQVVVSPDGLTSTVPHDAAIHYFLQDLPLAEAEAAAARLTPQPEGGRKVTVDHTPNRFGRIPRLYVEATDDRSVVIAAQRRMQKLVPGAERVSLDTGHAPHVSAPDQVAGALAPFFERAFS